MLRLFVFGIFVSLTFLNASGQDLGSSNKLFGTVKKKSPSKTAKKPPTPAPRKSVSAASTKSSAAKSPDKSTATKSPKPAPASKDRSASKTTPKKVVNITKSTAAQAEPAKKNTVVVPPVTVDKNRFAGDKRSDVNSTAAGKSGVVVPTEAAKKGPPSPIIISAEVSRRFEELIVSGNNYRDDRDYAAAELAYTKAKELKPSDSRAIYGLGNLYSDQLRWQEAEKQYRQAIALSPNDTVAHIALSYVLVQPVTASNLSDRYEEAEKLARRALELGADNALAHDQLGVSLELRGFIGAETENAYRKAIQLDPAFAPPHAHLGRLLRRKGQTKEAALAYQNAVERSREVGTKILVAEVFQSEQRFEDSETLLRAALKEDPKNPTALLLLARALTTTSNYDEAEATIKKALSIGSNGFLANSQLAGIYLRQNKPELAENALIQAARFVSELDRRALSQGYEAVGDAYMKAGNNKNAERAFKQAITYDSETDVLSGKLSKAQQGRFIPGN